MKTSNDLHILIKSLKNNEKRYFKIYATRHLMGKNNEYVELFNKIASQEKYDEAEIKGFFRGRTFLRQLPVKKNYLFRAVMKSLHLFHGGSSVDAALKEQVHFVELMYRKGLYHHCLKVLRSAKKKAHRYEKLSLILELIAWQKRLNRALMTHEGYEKEISELIPEETRITGCINNLNAYMALSARMILQERKTLHTRSRKELEYSDGLIRHPVLANEQSALTRHAKIYYCIIFSVYHLKQDRLNESYDYRKKAVQIFESAPHFIKEEPEHYLAVLNNYLLICNLLGKREELMLTVKKLRGISGIRVNPGLEARIFVRSYDAELNMYFKNGDFEKASGLICGIEEGMVRFKQYISDLNTKVFLYNIAYVQFGAGRYREALTKVNELLSYPASSLREDLLGFARLLNLVIHFELGNYDLMNYLIRSTYYYMKKKDLLFETEKIILGFISQEVAKIDPGNKAALAESFRKLRDKLSVIAANPLEKNALEYFDFISWLESKITGASFAEIVRKKAASPVKNIS